MTAVLCIGGLIIGASLALFGAGGTALVLPFLLTVGIEPKAAIAVSLVVVAVTSALAAIVFARAGQVAWRTAAGFTPFAMLGGYVGGRAAEAVSGELLVLLFAGLMLVGCVAALLRGSPRERKNFAQPHSVLLAGEGIAVGAITGLVGAGGGFLLTPALSALGGLSWRRSVGTGLVLVTAQSVAALGGVLHHVALDTTLAIVFGLAASLGAIAALKMSGRVSSGVIRRSFATMTAIVALWVVAIVGARMVLILEALSDTIRVDEHAAIGSDWRRDPDRDRYRLP